MAPKVSWIQWSNENALGFFFFPPVFFSSILSKCHSLIKGCQRHRELPRDNRRLLLYKCWGEDKREGLSCKRQIMERGQSSELELTKLLFIEGGCFCWPVQWAPPSSVPFECSWARCCLSHHFLLPWLCREVRSRVAQGVLQAVSSASSTSLRTLLTACNLAFKNMHVGASLFISIYQSPSNLRPLI